MTKNIAIIGVLFFVFGFITWVNAILRSGDPAANRQSAFQEFADDVKQEIAAAYPSTILRRHAKAELFLDEDSALKL
jgi:hypothetical protein